jgi:hypothetical protein
VKKELLRFRKKDSNSSATRVPVHEALVLPVVRVVPSTVSIFDFCTLCCCILGVGSIVDESVNCRNKFGCDLLLPSSAFGGSALGGSDR